VYLNNVEQLISDLDRGGGPTSKADAMAWVGVAPHSVRAVPLDYLKQVVRFADERELPVHMHVAEQQAEVTACIQEYGRSPVALLATEGLLSESFTGVHMIHVTPKAVGMFADASAMICACPTTERNLGDGIVPTNSFFKHGVRVALGTDSHTEIDLLEDARELEYHLRLQKMERAVLASAEDDGLSAIASRLFACATTSGAESIAAPGGTLEPGGAADFFTVDLNDPSIAGASSDDLLSAIVFSLSNGAVKDVVVGGKRIVEDGRHAQQDEIVERFKTLQQKLWG
jgi:formimidoylglutamate deiminase